MNDLELNILHADGFIEPLDEWKPERERHRADFLFKWIIPGVSLYQARNIPVRGMSSKVGEFLARKLRQGELWADACFAQIQMRIEPPRDRVA